MPTTDRVRTALGDRYIIEREIGAGGMATVFLARDIRHDREVAIKVLRADLAAVLGTERFLSEVRIAAQLDHPHILTLIDSGEADGILYYVMPFVRGESLRTKLEREKQLGIDDALAINRQVASALEYAHGKGIIHRDIKPENILLHHGEAVLADFGIALAVKEAGANRLTETGLSLGTPQYMSPEQATGDRVLDARSDVYSLGAVLYEMLGGEPPVTGATAQAMIAKLLTEKPMSLRVVRDAVTPALDKAVMKALAKVPADRFSSAGAFAGAIDTAAQDRGEAHGPRLKIPLVVAAVAAVAVAAGVGGMMWMRSRPAASGATSATLGSRTQVTFTGRVKQGAISDDAKTIAYPVEDCTAAGCTYGIEIQEVGGAANRRIFEGSKAPVTGLSWSPDRRTVMFRGEVGGDFARALASTIGGPATAITRGLDNADFYGSDSVVTTEITAGRNGRDLLILSLDGEVRARIPVVDSTEAWVVTDVMWVADSPWFIARLGLLDQDRFEYRAVHRSGKRVDQPADNRRGGTAWASADALWRMLIVAGKPGQRALERRAFDRNTGLLSATTDTVYVGKADFFSVTRDGSAVLVNEGTTTNEVWALSLPDALAGKFPDQSKVATTTSFVAGDISPDGQRLMLVRDVGGQVRLSVRAFEGGPETPLNVRDIVASDWVDSVTLSYLAAKDSGSQLGLIDVRTGAVRDTLDLAETAAFGNPFQYAFVHPDGWVWRSRKGGWMLRSRNDPSPRALRIPARVQIVTRVQPSRDGRRLAVLGILSLRDSSTIVMMDRDGSSPVTWATVRGIFMDLIMGDVPIAYVSRSFGGQRTISHVDGPGRVTPLGTVPRSLAVFAMSSDLKRAVVSTTQYQGDAWLMRVNRH